MARKQAPRGDEPIQLPSQHSEETRQRVIDMYKAGHRLAEITAETSVPRATIYYILKREGIRTDRVARGPDEALSMSDVLDELRRAMEEVGRLREALDRERAVTRWFLDHITIPPDVLEELSGRPTRGPARPRSTPKR